MYLSYERYMPHGRDTPGVWCGEPRLGRHTTPQVNTSAENLPAEHVLRVQHDPQIR